MHPRGATRYATPGGGGGGGGSGGGIDRARFFVSDIKISIPLSWRPAHAVKTRKKGRLKGAGGRGRRIRKRERERTGETFNPRHDPACNPPEPTYLPLSIFASRLSRTFYGNCATPAARGNALEYRKPGRYQGAAPPPCSPSDYVDRIRGLECRPNADSRRPRFPQSVIRFNCRCLSCTSHPWPPVNCLFIADSSDHSTFSCSHSLHLNQD